MSSYPSDGETEMTKQMDSRFHGNDEVTLFPSSSTFKTTPKKWATLLIRLASCIAIAVLLPTLSSAELAGSFDEPDTVFASNLVVDIIEHNGGVWFATGEGVNFSLDSGQTWLLYDASNGLVSDNISAIYSFNDSRIWIASNHGFGSEAMSDGLSYSDDNGQNWYQVNFDSLGIDYVWGGNRTIYDITGHHDDDYYLDRGVDWLFFTAFAGGFLASQDGGMNWRRIFSSPTDSINFAWTYFGADTLSLRNRYFSCVTDTSHTDSLYVWAGTAGGLFQYVYASPRVKPSSKQINSIAFCDQCGSEGYVYLGGDRCLTRGSMTGPPFISRFESDGLPGPYVSAVTDFRGKLFVGTMDSADGSSTGLAVSTDQGNSYVALPLADVVGDGHQISDFAVVRERLYMVAEEAGLFVSDDTGETWLHLWVDTFDTTSDNKRNVVYALSALADTLRAGTDSGLVTLYLDSVGQIDSSRYEVFPENDSSSTKVIRVKTQLFYTDETYDSLAIWTVNRPLLEEEGTPVIFRSYDDADTLFTSLLRRRISNDIDFIGDTAIVVSEDGLRYTKDGGGNWSTYNVYEGNDNINKNNVKVMAVRDDTIFFGTDDGFAISNDRGETYKIYRVNTDSLGADFVVNYAVNVPGITGDFIPALGVQYIQDEEWARSWVSCRPALAGSQGISVGLVTPVDSFGNVVHPDSLEQAVRFERRWESVYRDGFAWNFAFNGDSVFAATDGGLLFNHQDTGLTWNTIDLVDTAGVSLVLPGTPVYAVEVIDDHLLVGTGDRTLRLDLSNLTVDLALYVVDSGSSAGEVYAFPVPFSHSLDLGVDFHFTVEREADITLEIYDFAMNLVSRIIDNQRFSPGIYPTAGAMRRTWDGRNDRGEQVAVGMYYFKVEYSTGEVRWGKVAVIP
jgi:hypothetical protein